MSRLVDWATSVGLNEPNWTINISVCEAVNQDPRCGRLTLFYLSCFFDFIGFVLVDFSVDSGSDLCGESGIFILILFLYFILVKIIKKDLFLFFMKLSYIDDLRNF